MDLRLVKLEAKEEQVEGVGEDSGVEFITIPLSAAFEFFWSSLHAAARGYSLKQRMPLKGRFSFMLVVYGRLFSGVVSIRLEREEIERQIPEKYRTHKFQANSVAHWTEVSWKYDPLKQLVYPSIHYEVRCGLDGTVKWFVVGRFPPLHSLFSLLAHLLSTELCPMPFLRFLLPFLRFWQGVSHQIPVICTGSNPIHSNALTLS
jgi:hypothetical protein